MILVSLVAMAGAQEPKESPTADPSRFNRFPAEPFPIRQNVETVAASEAPLEDGDLVVGVVIGSQARAYPMNFLVGPRNEIINDALGGEPLAVTWCSVNRSPSVYDRRLGDKTLSFGVRGVRDATLIMYDAETRSLWSQLVGDGLEGSLKGQSLEKIPAFLTTWGAWKALHPDTSAYVDWGGPYYSDFSPGAIRDFAAKGKGEVQTEDLVIGLEIGGVAKAYAIKHVAAEGPVNDQVNGKQVLVFLNPDMTTLRIFDRQVQGRTLTFRRGENGELVDRETESRWNAISLTAESGPLKGNWLELLPGVLSLWQGWKLYRPKTALYSPKQ